jgi:hypothetical protein
MNGVVFISASATHWPLLQFTAPAALAYAQRWGMGFQCHRLIEISGDITKTWTVGRWEERILALLHAMQSSPAEWFLFLGADVMLTSPPTAPDTFTATPSDLIIGSDDRGINDDLFFIRNNYASHKFLEGIAAQRNSEPNEQTAMIKILAEGWYAADVVPLETLQGRFPVGVEGRPEWHEGMFALHAAALPMQTRLDLFKMHMENRPCL